MKNLFNLLFLLLFSSGLYAQVGHTFPEGTFRTGTILLVHIPRIGEDGRAHLVFAPRAQKVEISFREK